MELSLLADVLAEHKLKPMWETVRSLTVVLLTASSTFVIYFTSSADIVCAATRNANFSTALSPAELPYVIERCSESADWYFLSFWLMSPLLVGLLYASNNFWEQVPAVYRGMKSYRVAYDLLENLNVSTGYLCYAVATPNVLGVPDLFRQRRNDARKIWELLIRHVAKETRLSRFYIARNAASLLACALCSFALCWFLQQRWTAVTNIQCRLWDTDFTCVYAYLDLKTYAAYFFVVCLALHAASLFVVLIATCRFRDPDTLRRLLESSGQNTNHRRFAELVLTVKDYDRISCRKTEQKDIDRAVKEEIKNMGLLSFDGEPLDWEDIKKHVDYIKKHGITQFIYNFERMMQRPEDILKWGDEVEFMIVRFDDKNKKVQLSLRGNQVCEILQEKEKKLNNLMSLWQPEYACYMIEGTPGIPYLGFESQLNEVEANMRLRRKEVQSVLEPGERIMTISVFPRLGCHGFTHPRHEIVGPESNPISRSLFFPDQAISGHPRFPYLTKNIRQRRGENIAIHVPIFQDERTPSPFIEKFNHPEAAKAAKPDHIYMDCMGFGMGNTCLQVTFQACNVEEAKFLYDQLAPVCPVVMALSAASPIFRGYLSDIDVRWPVTAGSVDDRTLEERGLGPTKNDALKHDRKTIRKSRFDSLDSYLSKSSASFNDIDFKIDEDAKKMLIGAGIDEQLAQHIAHLWIRDPLTLFSKKIELDDENETYHFENIQSTNWQSLRFKPPPPRSDIGWRIEFRVMESQLTDFESAAFVVFVVLLTRAILTFKLDFLIPMSLVEENMRRAHKNNAVNRELFHFRENVFGCDAPACCTQFSRVQENTQHRCAFTGHSNQMDVDGDDVSAARNKAALCQEMSVNTIINGKAEVFPGLIPLIRRYLDSVEIEVEARCRISEYLNLISKRASGELMTTAQWMRHFVTSHPEYERDSVVTDSMAYDLLRRMDRIEQGEVVCHELFGSLKLQGNDAIDNNS